VPISVEVEAEFTIGGKTVRVDCHLSENPGNYIMFGTNAIIKKCAT